ncbi:hypothetical protein IV102_07770 [bacterium]|nr:hypothetical protein [bacterium]
MLCLGAWTLFFITGCGSVANQFMGTHGGVESPPVGQLLSSNNELHFAVIEGVLSQSQPTRTHGLRIEPGQFRLPAGQGLLKLTLEHERGLSVALSARSGFTKAGQGLLVKVGAGNSYQFDVAGSGAYRILISMAGDMDGDGDVDDSDLARLQVANLSPASLAFQVADLNGDGQLDEVDQRIASDNQGVSTRLRPLDVHLGLHPSTEPHAALHETLGATATFLGQASPGASVLIEADTGIQPKALSIPVTVDPSGEFVFQTPLAQGDNAFQAVASDGFGQRVEGSTLVSRVAQPSEPPSRMDADKRNRIWLLDVHANNYLFRGPLPLTSLEETGRVDFQALIQVMNQRLLQEQAPLSTLPSQFKFIEIALITNRATQSASHGDEGFALHHIYKSILGSEPPWPADDNQDPTSLYTKPLDNEVIAGATFTESVAGKTYTIQPGVSWLPVSANSTGEAPTTLEGGPSGYETILKSTFPIVSIAPDLANPQRKLTNPLSNVSVAARYVHQVMQPDHSQDVPHVFYVHCVNGHDRTGMVTTAYVLSAYGQSFGYDLATAYKYGQMGAFLPDALPPDVDARRNYWDKLEENEKNTGKLKKKYMQAVQALAYFYHHPVGAVVPKEPRLTREVPARQLWQAGFTFADPAATPIQETPPDYLHVRATP